MGETRVGFSGEILREVYKWLSEPSTGDRVTELMASGHQVFLVVGADGNPAVWTASDFADYAFMRQKTDADAFLLLNSVVNEFRVFLGKEPIETRKELYYNYREYIKEIKMVWEELPENSTQ